MKPLAWVEVEMRVLRAECAAAPWKLAKRGDYSDFEGNSRVLIAGRGLGAKRIAAVQHDGSPEAEMTSRIIESSRDLYKFAQAYAYDLSKMPECPDKQEMLRPVQELLRHISKAR